MRYAFWSGSVIAVLLSAPVVWGQASDPQPAACEQQVQEQYGKLSTDTSLQTTRFAPQALAPSWDAQLLAITSQLRKGSTRYEIKDNQEKLAVQNVAELLEQLRQMQEQLAKLRADLEKPKTPPVPPPPPTN